MVWRQKRIRLDSFLTPYNPVAYSFIRVSLSTSLAMYLVWRSPATLLRARNHLAAGSATPDYYVSYNVLRNPFNIIK